MVERNGSETLKTELMANLLYENIRIKTLQTISTVRQVIPDWVDTGVKHWIYKVFKRQRANVIA